MTTALRDKIKKKVAYYVWKYNTRDPFRLANALNVEVQIDNTGSCCGCYMFLKNHRYIFLNQELEEQETNIVLAHELGHAVMYRKQNCYFLRKKCCSFPELNEKLIFLQQNCWFRRRLFWVSWLLYRTIGMITGVSGTVYKIKTTEYANQHNYFRPF